MEFEEAKLIRVEKVMVIDVGEENYTWLELVKKYHFTL